MSTLQNKIDFAVIFRVANANPNGDPLNGNRPRTDYANFGEVTDVAVKRKLRDRLLEAWVANGKQEDGNKIYVQSDDRRTDECRSLRERFEKELGKDAGGLKQQNLHAKSGWTFVRSGNSLLSKPLRQRRPAKRAKKKETHREIRACPSAFVAPSPCNRHSASNPLTCPARKSPKASVAKVMAPSAAQTPWA